MKNPILQKEHKILRAHAHPIPVKDIKSPHVQKIITAMKDAMHPVEDAVAIAAPQIGESLRIFVVSGIVFKKLKLKESEDEADTPTLPDPPDLVCINPEILKRSKDKKEMEEGCLSVRWLYGYVKRSQKVTLRAYDEGGKRFTRGASGLLAQIFQHETDHLDGVLFIDKARDVREMRPEKMSAAK